MHNASKNYEQNYSILGPQKQLQLTKKNSNKGFKNKIKETCITFLLRLSLLLWSCECTCARGCFLFHFSQRVVVQLLYTALILRGHTLQNPSFWKLFEFASHEDGTIIWQEFVCALVLILLGTTGTQWKLFALYWLLGSAQWMMKAHSEWPSIALWILQGRLCA